MAVGFAQPLRKISTTNNSWWGKGGRCVGVTTFTRSCTDYLEIWEPENSWNPLGLDRSVQRLLYL